MLYLNKEAMEGLCTMAQAIDLCGQAARAHAQGKALVPLRTNLDLPQQGGQTLFMPGFLGGVDALGVKIVSVYPGNNQKNLPAVPATMVMLDETTGMVSSLMDGDFVTRLRTGALSGFATKLLAHPEAKRFVIIGTGGQALTQVQAVLTARPSLELVEVFDLDMERAQAFAQKAATLPQAEGKRVQATSDLTASVAAADIITTVTTSKKAVFDGSSLLPHCHVNGVGSYTPEMAEVPDLVVAEAALVVVDTPDALAESGDLINPIKAGLFSPEQARPLGALSEEEALPYQKQRTFFETVGNAAFDLIVACAIEKAARAEGKGQELR